MHKAYPNCLQFAKIGGVCTYHPGDFARPKIVWKIIGSRLAFAIDDKGYMLNNACYIMTGEHLHWILAFLNSSPLIWYSEITNMNKTGVGDAQVGLQNIILFPIPSWNGKDSQLVENLVKQLTDTPSDIKLRQKLAEIVYSFFHLDKEEIAYLESLRL